MGCTSTYALGIIAFSFASAQEASLAFGTNDGEEVCEQQWRKDREFLRFSLQVNIFILFHRVFWIRGHHMYCYRMFDALFSAMPWQRTYAFSSSSSDYLNPCIHHNLLPPFSRCSERPYLRHRFAHSILGSSEADCFSRDVE